MSWREKALEHFAWTTMMIALAATLIMCLVTLTGCGAFPEASPEACARYCHSHRMRVARFQLAEACVCGEPFYDPMPRGAL